MIAIVLTVLTLAAGARMLPALWVCYPGKTPAGAPSNCERVPYRLLWKAPVAGVAEAAVSGAESVLYR